MWITIPKEVYSTLLRQFSRQHWRQAWCLDLNPVLDAQDVTCWMHTRTGICCWIKTDEHSGTISLNGVFKVCPSFSPGSSSVIDELIALYNPMDVILYCYSTVQPVWEKLGFEVFNTFEFDPALANHLYIPRYGRPTFVHMVKFISKD